jgi:hypothetical protein
VRKPWTPPSSSSLFSVTTIFTQCHPDRQHRYSACPRPLPQIWCRGDAGEWHGLTKGRASRTHEFRVQLDAEIRRRNSYLRVRHNFISKHNMI